MIRLPSMITRVETIFKLRVYKKDGSLKEETPEFKNIVLDQGLARLGVGAIDAYCRVGSGSSTPEGTQIQLDQQVASTGQITERNNGVNVARGYSYITRKYRFETGVAAGNLTEVGVGWGTTGSTLYNRAMIRDTANNPTTVTVLADEVLDIFVELRSYTALTTSRASVIISGTSYEIYYKPLISAKPSAFSTAYTCDSARGYTGIIQDSNVAPSGVSEAFGVTNNVYVAGSLERAFSVYWGLNQGNTAPLKTVVIETPFCTYQAQFEPAIPKTAETILKLSFKVGWGRYE